MRSRRPYLPAPLAIALLAGCAFGGGGAGNGTAPARGPLEKLQLTASRRSAAFATALAAGEIYLLKASGTVSLGAQTVDADYVFGGTEMASDEAGGADVGVDIGEKQIQRHVHYTATPPGPGRMKWAGEYRQDHVYYMTVTGEGRRLSLALTAPPPAGGGGDGAIAVELHALSPAPPRLGPELEKVAIPITRTVVTSNTVTRDGQQYLLQASGAGRVGGGGMHLGDAEYMDWNAVGHRRNEGEAGADFGIGVDETSYTKMKGSAYTPRRRWWGPWRADHTYYLLFTGTGRPIQFLYFDSGYGDNSRTDQLSVRIFAVP